MRREECRPSHWLENLRELSGSARARQPAVYRRDVTQGLAAYEYAANIRVHLPSGAPLDCVYRAPRVEFSEPYLCCLGSAHTFGRWASRPYPHLLADSLGVQVLNLGYGGAGPELYLGVPEYVAIIQRAALVIVQVMSGRSSSSSLWRVLWGRRGQRIDDGAYMLVEEFLRGIGGDRDLERRYVSETLATYYDEMRKLLTLAQGSTLLLWFSDRAPLPSSAGLRSEAMKRFPQLVDDDTIASLRTHATAFAECIVANEGNDAAKVNRPATRYYPSSEMHREAARILEQTIRANPSLQSRLPDLQPARRRQT